MLQLRNMLHRQFHAGFDVEPDDTVPQSSDTSSSSSSFSSSSSSSSNSSFSSSASSGFKDTTSPRVINTFPISHAIQIAVDSNVSATFSEYMNASTITNSSFTLRSSTVSVPGTVTYAGTTATFNPMNTLAPGTIYIATISTGAKDLAGNEVSGAFTWSFQTASTPGPVTQNTNESPVVLGAASTFGVLAGSTVTNIGNTTVTGDVGVSAGTAVTGFGPGIVTGGAIHATDTLAAQAQSALTVAYNDLAGRSVNPVSLSGNLGGRTLGAGLYKSTSGLEISSGDLTLDGNGDANAVFIFQIASTLNVSSGRQVILIGGAKASNIFWQVGTSANLEANSVFKGSILADQSISLQTGARVDGRLLARIGAVTLQGNTIVVPAN